MAGNADLTALWEGADVYVNFTPGAEGPLDVDTPWGAGWEAAGLLDGEEGVTQSREEESSEHYAWGGQLYKRTKSKHKRSFSFVALEDNATTFRIVNPGSDRDVEDGVRRSVVKVPTTERFAVGFEFREGDKIKRRWAKVAEVQEVGDISEKETDPTVYEVTVVLFPESDRTLFYEVETDLEG